MRRRCLMLAATLFLAGTTARAANQPPPSRASAPSASILTPAQAAALQGVTAYLPESQIPDAYRILPPAPKGASGARREDVAAYRETRKLRGGPRWTLAAEDAMLNPFALLDDMSCALGVRLDETNAPTLVRVLGRVGRDASHIVTKAKGQFKQARPFVALGGPICTELSRQDLAKSFSYPSGHATYSWAIGLILAELAPDKATAILVRARAFGESRVVCGVHWVSDVEEGRTNAGILIAVLHSDPRFMADMAAARREVAAATGAHEGAGGGGSASGVCVAGEAIAAPTPWTR